MLDAKKLVPNPGRRGLGRKRLPRLGEPIPSIGRSYPSWEWVQMALARAEANGHVVTWNTDGEFSSALITQAYVAEFLRLNKLVRPAGSKL